MYHLFVFTFYFSNFDREDFVKIQNFDGYDAIMK